MGDTEDLCNAQDALGDDQSTPGDRTSTQEVVIAAPDDVMAANEVKFSTEATDDKTDDTSPMRHSSGGGSMSTDGGPPELTSDAASVHSLPVVHVTEPHSPQRRPATARLPESAASRTTHAPPSPSRSSTSAMETPLTPAERRIRHRSAVENRASSRLSGFFNNLINRHGPTASSSSVRGSTFLDQGHTPGDSSISPSRPGSPQPLRAVTPPPQLPAPTLQELGLSLSVVTKDLSPSHFSAAPSSGAFLTPQYLLLCHAQGLDVLPLVSPPAPQPYALVRRVCFKSVVVMEQRGVLVAIAGRRDGVRVYALEEVKKAVEWRVEVEVRRERDRMRREALKKVSNSPDNNTIYPRDAQDQKLKVKARSSTPPPGGKSKLNRRSSEGKLPSPPNPRTPLTGKRPKTALSPPPPEPLGQPPPYSGTAPDIQTRLRSQSSIVSLHQSRSRQPSISNVLAPSRRNTENEGWRGKDPDMKSDWAEARDSSDDEAINVVAAGSSGSQALDERTSAMNSAASQAIPPMRLEAAGVGTPASRSQQSTTSRRNRPANLDLTLSRASNIPPPEPSPVPTLLTLRQALAAPSNTVQPETPNQDGEEEDEDISSRTVGSGDRGRGEQISLAQALFESRLPDLPPVGTRRPQQPILITSSHPIATGDEDHQATFRPSDTDSTIANIPNPADRPERRRRRWSVLDGIFSNGQQKALSATPDRSVTSLECGDASATLPSTISRGSRFTRSPIRSRQNDSQMPVSSTDLSRRSLPTGTERTPPLPDAGPTSPSVSALHSRFIPRIISNAFHGRRSDEHNSQALIFRSQDTESIQKVPGAPSAPHVPPPKLEYVKLPGTKGAVMIKAVETAKKSFLAILCGENGEKVELFAGTYRTALGLSRTFILPDSPRSLELQLQGDDLVEVFLMFTQNVFGLEPATVRVREVRIGRAERRAARRRAREIRTGEAASPDNDPTGDDDTNVNVSIGLSVSNSLSVANSDTQDGNSTLIPALSPEGPLTNAQPVSRSSAHIPTTHADELVALATAQMGPYTTFQQLSFAPNFPLASIADEYIIPPTYPAFLEYRSKHDPESSPSNNVDLTQVQFSPPGLPPPATSAPPRWFYRDPKGIIHGPWKAALMQAWYKDGLLPPDLPIRREEDTEYVLLKDLRLQSVDPTHPFRTPPPLSAVQGLPLAILHDTAKPLLRPVSLLSQPRHFGPPALFFSSRGGHSTAIVDARGRSVLKGRFLWSGDDPDDDSKNPFVGRMGDVKRLEAFDVKDRAVLVAMRQGGLEAIDLGDALLRPADESRTALPQFSCPPSNMSRRAPFVWKIGTPVSSSPTSATILTSRSKGPHLPLPYKKQSTGPARSPGKASEFNLGDADSEYHDEVLFLGRKEDEIYICERNDGAFRILRLCPNTS